MPLHPPADRPGRRGRRHHGLSDGPRELGADPATGEKVTVRRGPYGVYVQLGEGGTDDKGKPTKPRRASLTKDMDPDTLDLDRALKLLSLPRLIGRDPESGEEIQAGLGRFGPYIKVGSIFQSLEPGDDVLSLGMNRAMELLAKARAKVRLVGPHPKDKAPVEIRKGRFGPYAQHGKTVANLPRNLAMEDATLDEVVALLAEKGKELKPMTKGGAKGKAKPAAKRAAAKRAAGTDGGSGRGAGEARRPQGGGRAEAGGAQGPGPQGGRPGAPAARKPAAAAKKPAAKPAAKKPAAKKPAAPKKQA